MDIKTAEIVFCVRGYYALHSVAQLEFLTLGSKAVWASPIQPVRGSMDAKIELGVRGVERWLGRRI